MLALCPTSLLRWVSFSPALAQELRHASPKYKVGDFNVIEYIISILQVSLVTFLTYIYTAEDHFLRPETAFVAIALFNVLRFAINFAPMIMTDVIHSVISLNRINRFLSHDDLDPDSVLMLTDGEREREGDGEEIAISVKNGTFMWNPEIGPSLKK